MFFAALFAMYFAIRAADYSMWEKHTEVLNIPYATTFTVILVLSSVTCQLGVFKAEDGIVGRTGKIFQVKLWGLREWFVLTYLMGSIFIAGQAFEYAELVHEGLTIASSPYGSVFYLTTGFHGLHVVGGLLAFLFLLGRSFSAKRFGHHEATTAIVTSYYWHFVDVVWIALFAVIYLLK
jgi:cytochrome c oxidase subunit 3